MKDIRNIIDRLKVCIGVVFAVGYCMAAGVACYHQYLILNKDNDRTINYTAYSINTESEIKVQGW